MENVRLQKFFTDCGILSRRAAEEEIRKGLVKVNGEVADIGRKIDPTNDTVEYQGRIIRPTVTPKHYILLYKPRGIVTTLSDEKGRTTVADLVADVGARVYPVGRLDMDSDGLLLLTDDGALTERLTHPRHEIAKRYHVTVSGVVTPAQLGALGSSFLLDGYTTRPAKVSVVRAESGETVLAFELYEGRNRQIRRMCDQVGLRIRQLSRVAIGRIGIGDLVPGRYRHLTEEEVAYLRGEQEKPSKPAPRAARAKKAPKSTDAEQPKVRKQSKTEKSEQTPSSKKVSTTKKVLKAIKAAATPSNGKEQKSAKEQKEVKTPKVPKEPKTVKEPKAPKTPKEPKTVKEPKAPKTPKEPKTVKETGGEPPVKTKRARATTATQTTKSTEETKPVRRRTRNAPSKEDAES